MKIKPVVIYAISIRESRTPSAAVISKLGSGLQGWAFNSATVIKTDI